MDGNGLGKKTEEEQSGMLAPQEREFSASTRHTRKGMKRVALSLSLGWMVTGSQD